VDSLFIALLLLLESNLVTRLHEQLRITIL